MLEEDVVGIHAFVLMENDAEESADGCGDRPDASGCGDRPDAICRNFAPLYGIDEESATGTASCALAGYFAKYICKKETYVFEQGYSLNLPSKIVVKAEYEGDEIERIFVGGYGYLVEEKRLQV